MAYTREYPNNITPLGSKTKECLTNDDLELKRILNLFSEIGGGLKLFGSKRQCVLYGATNSSGNPSYLTANGLTIAIDGSTKPIILSFANGFSTTEGTADILDTIANPGTGASSIYTSSNPVIATGNHSHNISVGYSGGNAAFDNRPSFYTLAFVKKIK